MEYNNKKMAEKIQFYPIDIAYKIMNDKPVIFIYGRTVKGEQVCILDPNFEPYFWVIPKKGVNVEEKLSKIVVETEGSISKVTRTEQLVKKINGKEVNAVKVFTQHPKDVPIIKETIRSWDIIDSMHEYDILYVRRYLIDKQIIPMTLTEVEGDLQNMKSRVPVILAQSIRQVSDETIANPKVIAIDIETYTSGIFEINAEKNPILMIALYGDNLQKVITWKKFKTNIKEIEFVNSEADLISRTFEIIRNYKPDILTGYYSDGFDLPYLITRAKKYKISSDLGLDYSDIKISSRGEKTAYIEGIAHIDILKFIKRIFAQELGLESYKLDDVASEILNEKKVDIDIAKIGEAWDNNSDILQEYCIYNLHDAKLAYLLLDKTLLNLTEIVKIVGLPPFDINRMSYSQLVEWFIMRQAPQYNELAPNKPTDEQIEQRRKETAVGAFVYQPSPGLYKEITVFDFMSLYPSIISSHNIGPSTLNCQCCAGTSKVPETNLWFCTKKKGFIPVIIQDIITRRKRIKEMLATNKGNMSLKSRSNALKLLANSFYGYLGFAIARWYCFQCVQSVTAFGRNYIKTTINRVNEEGFKVIYSDTDSVFFVLDGKTSSDAEKMLEKINLTLPGLMELEFEGFYPRGLFVGTKEGLVGAKKKYALLDQKGSMKIRGFETVRKNSSPIAKEAQINALNIILVEESPPKALLYLKGIIDDLRKNKISINKVIITTQLTKDIDSYDSVGPHVAVAQKMRAKNIPVAAGSNIKYIIAKGPGRLRDKAKLPRDATDNDYDPEYYINNQVVPAVEKILEVFGFKKEDLLQEKQQSTLGSYFN